MCHTDNGAECRIISFTRYNRCVEIILYRQEIIIRCLEWLAKIPYHDEDTTTYNMYSINSIHMVVWRHCDSMCHYSQSRLSSRLVSSPVSSRLVSSPRLASPRLPSPCLAQSLLSFPLLSSPLPPPPLLSSPLTSSLSSISSLSSLSSSLSSLWIVAKFCWLALILPSLAYIWSIEFYVVRLTAYRARAAR